MNSRRTRRDVLAATAGLGLALSAGCLEDGAPTETDEGGDEAGGPTYRDWVLAASASSRIDLSESTVGRFDLTAIDAVSGSLPETEAQGLREAAFYDVSGVLEALETDDVDATFSFDARGTTDGTENVHCIGLEGALDLEPLRAEVEDVADVERETRAGYDVYTVPRSSIALRSDRVVVVDGGIDAEERASLLERVESGDYESDADDFETVADHLGDGSSLIGDFRSSMNLPGVSGWGGSIAFDGRETTVRQVTLYEAVPDDETIADAESDVEEGYGLGAYEEATVEADDRAIVVTARVDTEEYRGVPW